MDISKLASCDEGKYVNILEIYNDKSFIYSILCVETARYYNVLNYSFQLPIILSSSILSILNGSTQSESIIKNMPLINTVFNIFTALVLSINNVFKFQGKSNDFRNASIKFQKLGHMIESKVIEGNYNQDFINSVMTNYDSIVENIDDDIPSHILRKISSQYSTKKHMPTIINNGIERKMSVSSSYSYTPKKSPFKRISNLTLHIPKNLEDSIVNSSSV